MPQSAERSKRAHAPVLLREVLDVLAPKAGGIYIDGTFGAGGYTEAILKAAACSVIAIDRDPEAITLAHEMSRRFPGRLCVAQGSFADMERHASSCGAGSVHGVALDLGVSSMQLDRPHRGFSFRHDGPLDMRMGPDGPTAADVVNTFGESQLAEIIRTFGEERRARAIARTIVRRQQEQPIETTSALAAIVSDVVGQRHDGIHPATRTFQALRIFINRELEELARGLAAAEALLEAGGRLAVVSFHSLEDRIVKRFLAERSGRTARPSRHLPQPAEPALQPSFRSMGPPRTPDPDEIAANPRARSARLRAAERTDAPAWPLVPQRLGVPTLGAEVRR